MLKKKKKEGGHRKEQIQMSAGRKTAMAGEEAPEKEWAGCLGEIGQGNNRRRGAAVRRR